MTWADLQRTLAAPTAPRVVDAEIDFAIADPARRPGERLILAVIARCPRMSPHDLVTIVDAAIARFGSPAKALLMLNLDRMPLVESWH